MAQLLGRGFHELPCRSMMMVFKFLDLVYKNKGHSWFIFNLLMLSVEFKIYLILNKVIFYFEKNTFFFICIFQMCSLWIKSISINLEWK